MDGMRKWKVVDECMNAEIIDNYVDDASVNFCSRFEHEEVALE
jgi:hypothetical protein